MRMLFDYYDTNRLVIALDPSNIDLMRDFYTDRSTTRMLEVQCRFSDAYLVGHAKRVGLAGEMTSQETINGLLPTIRADLVFESDQIRDAGFEDVYQMREMARPMKTRWPLRVSSISLKTGRARSLKPAIYSWIDDGLYLRHREYLCENSAG